MERKLEPEVMDTWQDAVEYDSMDFQEVNEAFSKRALEVGPEEGLVLDAGTGTARIPILIAKAGKKLKIIGIDLSENMLRVGSKNIERAAAGDHVVLQLVDAKKLPYEDSYFDIVISNSILHHLPDPLPFLMEVKRVVKKDGALLIRDLLRPASIALMDELVAGVGPEYDARQKMLFRDSLHASFTLDEVYSLCESAGISDVKIYQSSDRHWTIERTCKEKS